MSHQEPSNSSSNIDLKLVALGEQYKKYIIELAKQDSFTIPIRIDSDEWEDREYKRHKILQQDYEKAEELAEKLTKAQEKLEFFDEDDEEYFEIQKEILDRTIILYKFRAKCYLSMESYEFEHAEWSSIKDSIHACEYRTVNTLPTYSHGLQKLFYEGKAHLTPTENEFFRMYRLWKKWRTKPWEINGGRIYPEDIDTMLKLDEFEADSSKRESQRREQKSGLKERAAMARMNTTTSQGT